MKLNIKKIIITIFIIFLSVFYIRLGVHHYKMITYPYPLEFREGAMVLTTDLMVRGIKPFMWENQPELSNVYGIFYHLVVYPFAKIFHSTPQIHRLVSAFFVLASCFIIFMALRRYKTPIYYILPAMLSFYAVLLFPGTTTPFSGPHSLGLFLFLCSLIVPWLKKYSSCSLIISGLCGWLAFYSKAYFVLGIPFLAIYLFLFISKKKSIFYIVGNLLFFGLTILLIRNIFDCYFNNTLITQMRMENSSMRHCIEQFKFFFKNNAELLSIVCFFFFYQTVKNFKVLTQCVPKTAKFFSQYKINFLKFDKPLINFPFDFNLFCLLCSFLILYLNLARHVGSGMAYLFQLLSPFLIILVFSRFKEDLWRIVTIPVLVIHIFSITSLHFDIQPEKTLVKWEIVESFLSKHQKIYNSPAIVSMLIAQNKKVYDSGLSECFNPSFNKRTNLEIFLSPLLLNGDRVEERSEIFLRKMELRFRRKYFDAIIITRNRGLMVPNEYKNYYESLGFITVTMPYFPQQWELEIFVPKKNNLVSREVNFLG